MKTLQKRAFPIILALVLIIGMSLTSPLNALAAEGTFNTISAGGYHTVAIKQDGSLWTWGSNWAGQLGDGTKTDRLSPVKIMDNVVSVSAGSNHSLAIKTDGSLWAWGNNDYGQLGDGTINVWEGSISYDDESPGRQLVKDNNKYSPKKVLDSVAFVCAGENHTMIIKKDGTLWAWGNNDSGQLGDGTTKSQVNPVKVLDSVIDVSIVGTSQAGEESGYSLAVKNDGSLWAWGDNKDNLLGDGTGGDWDDFKSVPTKIMDGVASVSAGTDHAMAVKTDGTLWAWGTDYKPTPTKILDGVKLVSTGTGHTLVLKTDNSLWTWGLNHFGQLGDGAGGKSWTDKRTEPKKIMDNVLLISAKTYYSMALKTDGSLWAWGYNHDGTLGDGTTTDKNIPIRVLDGTMMPQTVSVDLIDTASTWARDGITSALAKGFIPADLQSNYKNTITRAEFCRMAIKWLEYKTGKSIDTILAEKSVSRNQNAFSDTNDSDILAAYTLGITSGTTAPTSTAPGKFTPNGEFSREQAATMIRNTCKTAGMDVSNTTSAGFGDIGSASNWAVDSVNFCYANGIMTGTSTNPLLFSPKTTYTREQSILTFNNIK